MRTPLPLRGPPSLPPLGGRGAAAGRLLDLLVEGVPTAAGRMGKKGQHCTCDAGVTLGMQQPWHASAQRPPAQANIAPGDCSLGSSHRRRNLLYFISCTQSRGAGSGQLSTRRAPPLRTSGLPRVLDCSLSPPRPHATPSPRLAPPVPAPTHPPIHPPTSMRSGVFFLLCKRQGSRGGQPTCTAGPPFPAPVLCTGLVQCQPPSPPCTQLLPAPLLLRPIGTAAACRAGAPHLLGDVAGRGRALRPRLRALQGHDEPRACSARKPGSWRPASAAPPPGTALCATRHTAVGSAAARAAWPALY